MEDGVLLRRQFLGMSARCGRDSSKPFVQDAEMFERHVRKATVMTCHRRTYALSRFIRRMFFLANNSLKYSLSLSYKQVGGSADAVSACQELCVVVTHRLDLLHLLFQLLVLGLILDILRASSNTHNAPLLLFTFVVGRH